MNGAVKHAHKARRSLTTWEIDPKALNKNSFHTVHELTQVVDLWKKAANLLKSNTLFLAMLFEATYTVCVDNLLVFSLKLCTTHWWSTAQSDSWTIAISIEMHTPSSKRVVAVLYILGQENSLGLLNADLYQHKAPKCQVVNISLVGIFHYSINTVSAQCYYSGKHKVAHLHWLARKAS